MISRDLIITRSGGVHAQVVQELATTARSYDSSLFLRHEGRTAGAGEPVAVLALGIRQGASVTVLADGLDEATALEAVAGVLAPPSSDPSIDS